MDTQLCKLTLVVPAASTERILEILHGSEPAIRGFTMWTADGHGESFLTATISECVRGRVKRNVLTVVMSRPRAASLVTEIGQKAPIPHMAYWIEPILEFGRITDTGL